MFDRFTERVYSFSHYLQMRTTEEMPEKRLFWGEFVMVIGLSGVQLGL